jgi:hypothetical protein
LSGGHLEIFFRDLLGGKMGELVRGEERHGERRERKERR